ncbi:hypothetical protein BKA56DRAFT_567277 [Ilyonectria sp. MPI-CAGE-AT-0026]|nr:hypothetical protein BKA56DRAFT_567277 [Ilyonectria sp. MPI-CAGE-AT-0026]
MSQPNPRYVHRPHTHTHTQSKCTQFPHRPPQGEERVIVNPPYPFMTLVPSLDYECGPLLSHSTPSRGSASEDRVKRCRAGRTDHGGEGV